MTLEEEGLGATSLLQGEDGSSGPPPDLPQQHPSRDGDGAACCHHVKLTPSTVFTRPTEGGVSLPPAGMKVPSRGFSATTSGNGGGLGCLISPAGLSLSLCCQGGVGLHSLCSVWQDYSNYCLKIPTSLGCPSPSSFV